MKKEDLEVLHEAARLNEWYACDDIRKKAYGIITTEIYKPATITTVKKPTTKPKTKGKK